MSFRSDKDIREFDIKKNRIQILVAVSFRSDKDIRNEQVELIYARQVAVSFRSGLNISIIDAFGESI